MDIILVGATGAMGKTIRNLAQDYEDIDIVAGVADRDIVGIHIPVYETFVDDLQGDLIIDFSSPSVIPQELEFAKKRDLPLIIASTGHDSHNEDLIKHYSKDISILYTGNTSIGINVMEYLVEKMAKLLEGFDIEIVEAHHRLKKDSPSGTAKMLYQAANKGREGRLHSLEGRAGIYEDLRPDDQVGIASVRGGTIVGQHSVIFAGNDEVLEIKHTAYSKNIFAAGALRAAKFLIKQKPGLYNMDHVLELIDEED